MTTTTNWPNPERPGWPMFPERDGAHAFEYDNDSDLLVVYHWDSKEFCWLEFPKGSSKEWDKRPDLDGLKYHGPVLTPTQIAEMLAGERERAAQEAICIGESWNGTELSPTNTARHIAHAIRNLGDAP